MSPLWSPSKPKNCRGNTQFNMGFGEAGGSPSSPAPNCYGAQFDEGFDEASRVDRRETPPSPTNCIGISKCIVGYGETGACQERGLLAGVLPFLLSSAAGWSKKLGLYHFHPPMKNICKKGRTAAACLAKAHSVLRNTTASRRRRRAPYTKLSFSELGAGLLDYAAVVGCISIIVIIGMTVVGHRTADHYCEGARVLKLDCRIDENGNEVCRPDGGGRKSFWDPKLKCCAIKKSGGMGSPSGPECIPAD